MESLGDKISARMLAFKAAVPTIPAVEQPLNNVKEALKNADLLGYPVMLKASAGGGGKGMRLVKNAEEMESAFQMTRSEAKTSFGNDTLFVEKFVEQPHHVEVQILGDSHGAVIALGERDCSIQRRHQKVLEESPSPFISEKTRQKMMKAAIKLVKTAGYVGAGTLEFLVDSKQHFYFLEMNARLQVEHPVTELVTGIDLVKEQLHIATGDPLRFKQNDIQSRGHALECRIYAEDADNNFMPSPGTIKAIRNPEGPGVRIDSAVFPGSEISIYYDPMIAKLIVWGRTRQETLERMRRALREFRIDGVKHNISFHRRVLENDNFCAGQFDTSFIAQMGDWSQQIHTDELKRIALIAGAIAFKDLNQTETKKEESVVSVSPWKLNARREALQ